MSQNSSGVGHGVVDVARRQLRTKDRRGDRDRLPGTLMSTNMPKLSSRSRREEGEHPIYGKVESVRFSCCCHETSPLTLCHTTACQRLKSCEAICEINHNHK